MPIIYYPETNIFHIASQRTSYIFQIYKNAYPMHLYWGKRLRDGNIPWTLEAPYRRSQVVVPPEPGSDRFSMEYWFCEYPTYGNSDFRPPAYQVQDMDGFRISDAMFESYEIMDGKPPIPGLPATYAETDADAQTLKLTLLDSVLQLRIHLYYTVFPEQDCITRHTEFENIGDNPLTLTTALSVSLDMKQKPDVMLQLSGTALREKHIVRRELENGFTGFESTRGISSHQETPFLVLADRHTTENSGNAWGFSLVYSGNFTAGVSCDMYNSARILMGILPSTFQWELLPKATFHTPEAILTYSDTGLNQMSQNFHSLFRKHLSRGKFRDQERPVLLNTWEASYFNFTQDSILSLARAAQPLGIEMLVLDDGWFGHRNDDRSSLGDWYVNTEKLPNGLDGLAKEINALGMKFGLWFEPEMVSPDSDLYRQHPDWCIHVPNRARTLWRNQLVLDLSRDDVCDYIIESVSNILKSANIEYVKWDNNRRITHAGSELLPPHRKQEFFHRYVLNLYRILDALTSRFPDILFENCASGGARFDPGMMYYFSQTWASDNTDPVCRLKIQYGNSLAYPPVWITSHISASPNHQTKRSTPLSFRELSSGAFNLGYELDLLKLSPEESEEVKQQIIRYKAIRKLVQFGTFYRLKSPFDGNETAWMTVSPDKGECLVWYFKPFVEAEEAYFNLKLQGLDPDKNYQSQTGEIYGGDALMQVGLNILWENGDFMGNFWHFKEIL